MSRFILAFALLAVLQYVIAEVTVVGSPQVIYDRSPKIRLKGSGFDAEDHDITLEIGASGVPPLKVDKDFTVTKDDDGEGVVLRLVAGRKYVFLFPVAPTFPYALFPHPSDIPRPVWWSSPRGTALSSLFASHCFLLPGTTP